jgi:Ca-activated chloride channel family protein
MRRQLAAKLGAGLMWLGLALGSAAGSAVAATPQDLGGQVRAEVDGKVIQFPSLKTDITADVQGDLADVTVVQTFVNPVAKPLNATYLFPLNKDAAVHAMQMRIGDEIVAAKIERKEQARQIFETAKRDGRAAALLEQHRPNMFTQSVANLMPGQPIVVTLKYVQTVPRVDGAYQLKIPLVVGPRYVPQQRDNVVAALRAPSQPQSGEARPEAPAAPAAAAPGEWSFGPPPAYPPVNGLMTSAAIEEDRVALRVNLAAGAPIPQVSSATHAITTSGTDDATQRTVTLAAGRTIDNRDFVLRYTLAGRGIQAFPLVHRGAEVGTLSLMLEPPQVPSETDVTPREIVFLLDTSGSMSGFPIEASKLFMRHALNALRPTDYFRIIRFSNFASEMTSTPVPADAANLARAQSYVASLAADGGTEVVTGLTKAFDMRPIPGAKRILVFLSDGYVGNEAEILRMVSANIGQTHTYVFGIGTAVNHYLLAEMAHVGRGFVRFVDPTEKNEDAAIAFARKLDTTVMTDLSIDWGDVKVTEQTPAALPDLFVGDSLRVQGRFTASGPHTVKISGRINGRAATLPVVFDLPNDVTGPETAAIPLIWARSQIADEMRELMVPSTMRQSRQIDGEIEARVTKLGLDHALATQWTSFVAVSQRVVNDNPAANRDSQVPLPMVHSVGPGAYGIGKGGVQQAANTIVVPTSSPGQTVAMFGGASAPEPEAVGGLLVVLASLYATFRRRRTGAIERP